MSQKDSIHDAVKNALIKDGWIITADPYTLIYEDAALFADLAAERTLDLIVVNTVKEEIIQWIN